MGDIEKICQLQRCIDEYERFMEHLFFIIKDKDVNRAAVRFDNCIPLHEFIEKEVKMLVAKIKDYDKLSNNL